MQQELQGQVAVVTGGSKGYGTGIATALKKRGAKVWITGTDQRVLEAVSKRLDVRAFRADVTSPGDWDRLFEEVMGEAGRLDILVNNAGAGIRIGPLETQTDADVTRSIEVNLTGAILGCRRAVPLMKRQKSGAIVNVSSVCAKEAWPGWSVYSAAKAGIVQFSKCLYTEVREHGIRVTAVMPSWGATGFLEAAGLPQRDEEASGRCIQPDELGELIATICALPPHLCIEDVTLWPTVQEVTPL